jgi:hypothetical protein
MFSLHDLFSGHSEQYQVIYVLSADRRRRLAVQLHQCFRWRHASEGSAHVTSSQRAGVRGIAVGLFNNNNFWFK